MSFAISTVFKAVDRFTRPIARFQKSMLRYTGTIERQLKKVNKATKFVSSGIMKLGKATALAGAAGAVGFGLYVNSANAAVAQTDALAKSVLVSTETIEAYAAGVKSAGFQTDNIVDLIEEMNNKLGESAGIETITPVNEALSILGLNFENIRKLKPEQQFKQITDAALKMGDAQQAAAALDILMGGEANKIIGVLRNKVSSVDELTENYDKLNFMTDEARKGALKYAHTMDQLGTVVSTLGTLVSGLVGESLTPMLKDLIKWTAANKELIQQNVAGWVSDATKMVKDFIPRMREGWDIFMDWVGGLQAIKEGFQTFLEVTPWIMGLIAALKIAEVAMIAFNIVVAMNPIGLIATGIAIAIVGLIAMALHWDAFMGKIRGAPAIIKMIFAPFYASLELADLVIQNWGRVVDFFKNDVMGVLDKMNSVLDPFGAVDSALGLFGSKDTSSQPLRPEDFAAPPDQGQRMASTLREERTTNTSEVVIRDESGKASPLGRLAPGVRFASSEPLG